MCQVLLTKSLMHTDTAKYAHFTHQFLYGLVIDHKLFLQFFGNSPIAVTPFAFIVNTTYFSLNSRIFIRLWRIKLFAVIVICAARDLGNINEQPYFEFVPQFPYHLCFFSCRTLSETKAFNFFKYAFSARRRCTSAIRSSSPSFLIFAGRLVDLRPLR